ncbi:DEAD-domain-containing protein [Fistulina hepatica ATCC 64428]|uniref:ATP-dependent RNA helicase n=1 Tax=Fistulina hepatica ATCC 64428 TaxID=1128425 RepID=A0A0D7AGU4_9AGAR|nr:DEAD-domain-containing protein [Fistulina hepatica ATCC 64428]
MDDDIVLNLDTNDSPVRSKLGGSSKKGGRWTERWDFPLAFSTNSTEDFCSARSKRVSKRKNEDVPTAAEPHSRPTKRVRLDPSKQSSIQGESVAPSRAKPAEGTIRCPAHIISSLFSSNPKVDATSAGPAPSTSTSHPSNAPLDVSTLSGLGLDPLLIAHLDSRMSIQRPTAIQRAALPPLLHDPSDDAERRDIFLQSQTGSGKTLSFLLPIVQDLLPLGRLSYMDRSIGTLAIIIAPTRELAKQISDVLEGLLQLRLRPENETPDQAASTRLTRWLVSGLLTGGATRTHEKARLRKGLPILVATPGRLLDHLQNTTSFNVGKCRWLVLDEADRLMELGFEDTIKGIIQGLDGRRRLAQQAMQEEIGREVGGWDWTHRRRTILCSATIRDDVQKLAGTALTNPLLINAAQVDNDKEASRDDPPSSVQFTPPSQLSQKYTVVPVKLRLVALVALLRSLIAQSQTSEGAKIIVFLSCTDSVDFHWRLFGSSSMETTLDIDEDDGDGVPKKAAEDVPIFVTSPLLPNTTVFRLHGSLPTDIRLASISGFARASKDSIETSSVLLCTSVASRGLDLPLVRAVVQCDLPTEGGATEYVHRVGRTARVGKGGEAWSIVAPSENEWPQWVTEKMQGDTRDAKKISLVRVPIEDVLRNGFGGKGREYEERATDVQLSFERWVLSDKAHTELARKAFLSHMRAYATHPSSEKHIFHIRHLHIGHLAKAFALREAPRSITASGHKWKSGKSDTATFGSRKFNSDNARSNIERDIGRNMDTERRMQEAVRAQGRLAKQGGVLMRSGESEFQIAGGEALAKLVRR